MDRRRFLSLSAAAAVAATATSSLSAALVNSKVVDQLGLQLWTVRNQIQKDRKATLKSIADAGYKQVELGDIIGAKDLIAEARDLGLEVRSSFMNWEVIGKAGASGVTSIDEVIDETHKHGLKHLVFGYIGKGSRETAAQYQKMAETSNQAGEKAAKAGIQLCYHNHSFEFAKLEGLPKNGYEIFIERFDPKLVKFEVDVFWVKIGGWDPIETMERLNGRVSQVHLKDLKSGVGTITDEGQVPAEAFQEVGDGVIDFKRVLEVSAKIGVAEYHVEQDQSPDPLASIRQSLEFIKKI